VSDRTVGVVKTVRSIEKHRQRVRRDELGAEAYGERNGPGEEHDPFDS